MTGNGAWFDKLTMIILSLSKDDGALYSAALTMIMVSLSKGGVSR